ncbi:MAG: hypothetical protein ACOYES_03715 [Bacillota bacterium]
MPKGNSWGKTGIQSRQPIFTVDGSFAAQPGLILIRLDPGKVALQVSGMDDPAVIDMGWIGEGTPVYLQVFSSPEAEGGSAAVSIDRIQVGR